MRLRMIGFGTALVMSAVVFVGANCAGGGDTGVVEPDPTASGVPPAGPAIEDLTITKVTLNQGAQSVLFDASSEIPSEPEPVPDVAPGKAFGEPCADAAECSTNVCTPIVNTCGESCESAQCGGQTPDVCCPISGASQCLFGYCVAPSGGAGSGAAVENVPVASRGGQLVVELTADADVQERPVVVQLRVGDSFVAQKTVSATASGALSAAFDFVGTDFPANAIFDVELQEVNRGIIAQWSSAEDDPALQTGTLHLVMVPVRFNGDGSGRLPDTSDAQLTIYREWMTKLYPLAALDLSVHEPWDYGGALNSQGWSAFLQALQTLRGQEQPADNVYYHAVVAPADTFEAYCQGGCVAGLAPVPGPGQVEAQVSVGLGYAGHEAAETMAHEVGHAHGREHAPCGLLGQPADPGYPYDNAAIGGPGYDVVEGAPVATEGLSDIMSYCAPYWISDYTYSGIAQRMAFTNNTQARVIGVPRIVQTLIVDDDGQVMLGGALRVRQAPGGVPVDVLLQDARGKVGEVRSVPMQLLDHKRGGFIYLDALPPWVASVSYMGQAIPL